MRLNKKEFRKEFEVELAGNEMLRLDTAREKKQMEKELEEYYKEVE